MLLFLLSLLIKDDTDKVKDKENNKDKEKEKEEESDKISSSPILVGHSEEYDSLLRDLNAREKVCVNVTIICCFCDLLSLLLLLFVIISCHHHVVKLFCFLVIELRTKFQMQRYFTNKKLNDNILVITIIIIIFIIINYNYYYYYNNKHEYKHKYKHEYKYKYEY